MNYYQRFQFVTHLFFFRFFLKWAYTKGIADVTKLKGQPDFMKKGFSCLLCGASGEITAEEFITFVLAKNKKAKITIIDFGERQVSEIAHMVKEKYANFAIQVIKMNALDLTKHFKMQSYDWIETDGFIEYFDKKSLQLLLHEWKTLLKPDGFITTRDFASNSYLGSLIDKGRIWIINNHLTLTGYVHTKHELERLFAQSGFQFVSGLTYLPTFRRYALVVK